LIDLRKMERKLREYFSSLQLSGTGRECRTEN